MHAPAAPRLRTVLAFAAVALCLRAWALSAGPGIEAHYHPDAPKQVRAVEQFLRGDYLYVQNMHNLDGYPLFDSHLVEWLVRAGNPPLQAARRFLGLAAPGEAPAAPGPLAITWVMLLWNASLSAAAVALAVALGRRFGTLAAVLAGTFAALSPLDVAAAHYTTGDTAAAFFALATVYLAVRIVETGRVLHYVLAALATAAAFSSKYHAAEAGIAVLLAHLLRHPGLQVVRSAAAWRRAAAAVVALAAGIVLTSPALLVNFSWTVRSIRDFFGWVADYGLSEADLKLSFGARLLWSAGDNGAQIVRAAGAAALAGAALALGLARPRRTAWVVASLPLAHLAIAFAMKPVGHPVHHLPAVLPLLVLAAAGCAALAAGDRPLPVRAGGAVLALAGILWLGAAARNELFFFGHDETRRVAETWAHDSVPPTVAIDATRAFAAPPPTAGEPAGRVEFITPKYRRPRQPSASDLGRFFLEEDSLTTFRNPEITVRVQAPGLLAPKYDLPLWQPLPSLGQEDIAFVDAPAFLRSPLVRDLGAGGSFAVTAVSGRPLERAWLLLRAGEAPANVDAGFGGHTVERLVGAGELVVVPIEKPRPERSPYQGNHFYRWSARAEFSPARVALVADEGTLGRYLFNAGRFVEASQALSAAGDDAAAPGRRLERALAGLASEALDAAAAREIARDLLDVAAWDRQEVRTRFGIHPDWLDGLPYLSFAAEELFRIAVPGDAGEGDVPALATPRLIVEPGRYLVEVAADVWPAPAHLDLRDSCGRILHRIELAAQPPAYPAPGPRRFAAQLPSTASGCFLTLSAPRGGVLPPRFSLGLRPDVVGTVAGRLALLRRLLGEPVPEAPDPADYDALLAAGDRARESGDATAARALHEAAALADPGRTGAKERLGSAPRTPPFQQAGARFRGGVELAAYRAESADVRPGAFVGLEYRLRLPEGLERPDRLAFWVHGVGADGRVAFQGDHPLLSDARAPAGDDREEGCFLRFALPATVPPGRYELRTGLWQPWQEKRIRLLDAAVPHDRRGLALGAVTVRAVDFGDGRR